MADKSKHSQENITALFNQIATGYDNEAMRFFPFCADQIVARLKPMPGEKILDIATGTGMVALAAAQAVGPTGRVIGIDLAEDMLSRAQKHKEKSGLINIDLHVMDAAALDFRSHYFHHSICSFGIFFLSDMLVGLKEWLRVTRPGGRILFTCFSTPSFQPMADLFRARLLAHGVDLPGEQGFPWMRLNTSEKCQTLLTASGLENATVDTMQMGYHLPTVHTWWDVVWNSGFRGLLAKLPPAKIEEFRVAHLNEVAQLMTTKGLWLNVEVHFALGHKPVQPS